MGEPMTALNKANGVAFGEQDAPALGEVNPVFELPGPLFDLLPTAIYICDQDGLILRYNHALPNFGGVRPNSATRMNVSAGHSGCTDPMGAYCRTGNVQWLTLCAPVFPSAIERS
jgi:hypothetical protein